MWTTEATATTSASSEVIWHLWSDVANWKRWDTQVESSSLDGPFVSGTRGKLKPKGGPASSFVLLDTQSGRSFTDRSQLPGAAMDFIHEMASTPTGLQLTHRIRITGPLSPLFARLMGRKLQQGVQDAVQTLAHLAQGVEG